MTKLQGTVLDQPLRLRQSATLTIKQNERALQGLALELGEGSLTADGRLDANAIQAQAKLQDFSSEVVAGLLPSLPQGRINGELSLSGPLSDPKGRADFVVDELYIAVSQSENFELKFSSTLDKDRLSLLGNFSGQVERSATFSAVLPLRIEPQTLAIVVPEDEAISGRLDWNGDLNALWELVPLADHELSGDGSVALSLGGTLADPTLNGEIALSEARYENISAGTVLTILKRNLCWMGRP